MKADCTKIIDLGGESAPLTISSRTFSLGTMLILVTVFSVWMALAVTHPYLGVAGVILFAPALVRTLFAIRIAQRQGEMTSTGEKVQHLRTSLLMVAVGYLLAAGVGLAALLLGLGILEAIDALVGGRFESPGWNGFAQLILVFCVFVLVLSVLVWLTWLWLPRRQDLQQNEIVEEVEIVTPA